ncbi:restriction endonuclease subunit S [Glaesserella parasuis]|uniref:restriction endonuclease subunit S n=1 Tax=Glaesserella parasuis TaxID=738 RepID=UPI0024367F0E|nr:restriction endonuclease subunit S [Glaesserella parasuis]MDG6484814.1 restriction endonuclease subunit S [Glaesserella parasuis]
MAFNISELDFIFPNDWKLVRLGDIAKINAGSITKKDKFDFIKYIDISSVSTHSFQKPNILNFNDAPSRARRKLKDNDFIISTVRPNLRQYAFLNKVEENWIASTGFCVVSADNETLAWYLYSLVTSEIFTNYLVRVADGGAYPAFNPKEIEDAIIPLPNPNDLKIISSLAKDIYHKIELNTQINQTLEQIAQTIFKSWFIDFDPVHAKANALASGQTAEQATQVAMAVISGKNSEELHRLQTANPEQYQQLWEIAEAFPSGVDEEGVPWGWGYEKSENLFDVGIGKTPPRKEPEWFSENSNDIEWISIKDMGNSEVFVNKSSEYLLESAVNKFNVKRIPENTVILSFKLTVGRVGITTKETTTNEAIAHFRLCEKSYLTTEFLYLYLKNFDFNNLGSTSSIATAVNSKTIKEMEILYPTLEIINVFQYRVSDIFKTIRANSEQRNCLEKIRDELLPKLLSGELNGLPEKAI